MARLNGTLTVVLARPIASQDGKRRYEAGETVQVAIRADSDIRVWSGNRPPVGGIFREVAGSELPEALND